MSRAQAPHRQPSAVDIVGIPAADLADRLDHILAADSGVGDGPAVSGVSAMVRDAEQNPPAPPHGPSSHSDTTGHEDMLPQLRVLDAFLGKATAARSASAAPPFADSEAAERQRRRRRQALSRQNQPDSALPPPSPQAENDRLLLEEIGTPAPRTTGGWTAPPPQPVPSSPPVPSLQTAQAETAPAHPLTDEVMDGFVPPTPAKPKRTLRVKSKRAQPAPVAPPPVPPLPPEADKQPQPAAPAVRLKVKGPPRRRTPPRTEATPPALPAAASPPVPAPTSAAAPAAAPTVKLKMKGKPRRQPGPASAPVAAGPLPPTMPRAETAPVPAPAEIAPAPAPAEAPVTLKIKGKPRRHRRPPNVGAPIAETPNVEAPDAGASDGDMAAVPATPAPEQSPTPKAVAPDQPSGDVALLTARIEEIIALNRPAGIAPDKTEAQPGSPTLPENHEALAALLDEDGPKSDFAALDLLYACWHKNTHDCDQRALLAVAQQLSRNFGLPDKLPMASSKAWKMLDSAVFAQAIAERLAAVGHFIADWQRTQRMFLILEFSEIELIEHLFESLSPAEHSDLMAEVMNFKVLSNRRMGLLRRLPTRLRKQVQPLLPDRKEDALVILAHGKALLQRIADPHGFAPIVEVAGKMVEEMEKLMKQTANTGAPPPAGGPPGGGMPLGRIG